MAIIIYLRSIREARVYQEARSIISGVNKETRASL